MWDLSTSAASVLAGSHTVDYRATAVGPSGGSEIVPISGGLVTVSATSQVRRSATVNIADPTLWPEKPTDVLAPYGSALLIECGIVVPGLGTEWIPAITGVLTQNDDTVPQTSSSQGMTLTLADLSQKVHDNRLTSPLQVGGGAVTVVQAITSLIVGGYPAAVVVDETGDSTVCPAFTVQQERWSDGVEPLATSIGAEVACDPLGAFRIRYQATLNDPPVWRVSTGPGGNLNSASRTRTRSAVYNQVIVLGQASDGSTPVLATVEDDDPTSPTYVNGSFGRKQRFFSSPTVTTAPQATAAGQAILARAKGAHAQYVLTTASTNPALDAGDVFPLLGTVGQGLHILDQVTIPLDFSQQQQITTRSVVLPDEQGGSLGQLS